MIKDLRRAPAFNNMHLGGPCKDWHSGPIVQCSLKGGSFQGGILAPQYHIYHTATTPKLVAAISHIVLYSSILHSMCLEILNLPRLPTPLHDLQVLLRRGPRSLPPDDLEVLFYHLNEAPAWLSRIQCGVAAEDSRLFLRSLVRG